MRAPLLPVIVLCFVAVLAAQAQEKKSPPPVPALTIKKTEADEWAVFAAEKLIVKADAANFYPKMMEHLEKFAAYKDADRGYGGKSKNVLSISIDAAAPEPIVTSIQNVSAIADVRKFVLGTTQLAKPFSGPEAPKLESLPEGFIASSQPEPTGPARIKFGKKEEKSSLDIYSMWDAEDGRGWPVVGLDAWGRRVVDGNHQKIADIVPAADELPKRAEEKAKARNEYVNKLAEAALKYIKEKGPAVEEVWIRSGMKHLAPVPWIYIDLAHQAATSINATRKAAGQKELAIHLPYQFIEIPLPPGDEPDGGDDIVEEAEDDKSGKPASGPAKAGDSEGPDNPAAAARRKALLASPYSKRILAALHWLRDHQNPEGYWDAAAFRKHSTRKGAKSTANVEFVKPGESAGDLGWEVTSDLGITALSLLAFTAGGYAHKEGDFKDQVYRATKYLRKQQDRDGCFGDKGDDHFVYNHAYATFAIADLYAMSDDPILKSMVKNACDFIIKAQNPGLGWRYGVQPGTNDTSVTSAMVAALHASRAAGIEVPERAFDDAFKWFDRVTVKHKKAWKTGYDTPGSDSARLRTNSDYMVNPSLEAMHGYSRVRCKKGDRLRYLPDFLSSVQSSAPVWDRYKIDFYYWYWASQFLRLHNAKAWKDWSKIVGEVLTTNQRGWHKADVDAGNITTATLDEHGSWDAVDAWHPAGGRVYATAMGALILQTEWRVQAK